MDAQNLDPTYRRHCLLGFTVLELLICLGISAILLAVLLPALMQARESARSTVCRSHLRQIGIAAHQFHDVRGQLPRGWQTVQEEPSFAYGWAARLLPQLEMSTTAAAIDFQRAPADLRTLSDADSYFVSLFVCPSDIFQPTFELLADDERHDPTYLASRRPDAERGLDLLVCLPTSSFLGVHGTTEADEDDYGDTLAHNIVVPADGSIVHDRDVRFDDLKRGLSKTMIVGERTMAVIPSTWLGVDLRGEDAACRLVGAAITSPNCESCDECEFSSRHPGGSHFLWADGHVAIVSDTIDTDVYQENAKRNR